MWIEFNICCNLNDQLKLYDKFRILIKGWRRQDLINRFVLTFHKHYLLLSLNILKIPEPKEAPHNRHVSLLLNIQKNIPSKIYDKVRSICDSAGFPLVLYDYKAHIASDPKQRSEVEIITEDAAIGCEIAFEILDQKKWTIRDSIQYVNKAVKDFCELFKSKTSDPKYDSLSFVYIPNRRRCVLHFACNCIGWVFIPDFENYLVHRLRLQGLNI